MYLKVLPQIEQCIFLWSKEYTSASIKKKNYALWMAECTTHIESECQNLLNKLLLWNKAEL